MKKILGFVILAACSLGLGSCGANHSSYSENIIPWVYENTLGIKPVYISFTTQRDKEFADEYTCVEDTHEYPAFCVLAHGYSKLSLFSPSPWEIESVGSVVETLTKKLSGNIDLKFVGDLSAEGGFTDDAAEYYNNLFLAELEATAINIYNYWYPWEKYYNEYVISHTEILDQGFDENNLGDKYTGYYVVYALTGANIFGNEIVKYALVSITEYDDDSRYEYQILAIADSLKEINQYLE